MTADSFGKSVYSWTQGREAYGMVTNYSNAVYIKML